MVAVLTPSETRAQRAALAAGPAAVAAAVPRGWDALRQAVDPYLLAYTRLAADGSLPPGTPPPAWLPGCLVLYPTLPR